MLSESLEAERPRPRKVCDQLTESSDDTQYFLNPTQNMATAALMLRSILESDKLKAKTMYQNLCNIVERATVQRTKIDRHFTLGIESYGLQTTLPWSRGAQPASSMRTRVPMKDHIKDIHDA